MCSPASGSAKGLSLDQGVVAITIIINHTRALFASSLAQVKRNGATRHRGRLVGL